MHYALVLLALGALLALHELGHLVAARLSGVRVPRFVFGFGPPLVSFRLWGTQYVVAAVPLGATAHIQGMNPHRADAAEAASFGTLGPLKRLFIILAGPLANYLLALGVLFALYTSGTHVVVPLTVGTVQPGSEAARAQLLPGDRIVRVDGQAPRSWSEFVEKVAQAPGRSLELAVERHGEARTVLVRPRPDERGEGRIGVSQQYVYKAHGAGEALGHALAHTGNVASEGLGMLVRVVSGPERSGMEGPGALMRQESSDAASSGLDSLLRALVAASVALALLTLLPVPGLDGGRVMLLLVEAASGRRLPARVETMAQTVGFLAIAAAILVLAGAEIRRALPERPAQTATPAAAQAATPAAAQAPAQAAPGASAPAQATMGGAAPAQVTPGAAAPAQAATGIPVPAQLTTGTAAPAQAATGTPEAAQATGVPGPAQPGTGTPAPPQAVTGALAPAQPGTGQSMPAPATTGAPASAQEATGAPASAQAPAGALAPMQAATGAPAPAAPGAQAVSGSPTPSPQAASGARTTAQPAPPVAPGTQAQVPPPSQPATTAAPPP